MLLQEWEDLVRKMTDFRKHRFTLRCVTAGVILVSLKLKYHQNYQGVSILSQMQKGSYFNERGRCISDTIDISRIKGIHVYTSVLDRDAPNDCQTFINRVRVAIHLSVMEHQKAKFNRLWHKTTSGCQNNNKGNDSNVGNIVGYMCTVGSSC